MTIERAGIAVLVHCLLALGVAAGAGLELLVDPGAIQELHQRPVQHIDPDHRRAGLVAMVVPGAVRGEDDVAAMGLAALALDIGVAALVGQDGAAGVRAVDVGGRDVARIIDRDRATDGVGDLQAAVEAGIGEQDALPVGELDRRDVGLAGNVGDAIEVLAVFLPAPAVGRGLHLVGGDPAARHLAGTRLAAGVGEPGALRRRVHLGADPDVRLAGVGIEFFHQLPRLAGKRRAGVFLDGHEYPPVDRTGA